MQTYAPNMQWHAHSDWCLEERYLGIILNWKKAHEFSVLLNSVCVCATSAVHYRNIYSHDFAIEENRKTTQNGRNIEINPKNYLPTNNFGNREKGRVRTERIFFVCFWCSRLNWCVSASYHTDSRNASIPFSPSVFGFYANVLNICAAA